MRLYRHDDAVGSGFRSDARDLSRYNPQQVRR